MSRQRTQQGHLNSLQSKFGQAAAIGGVKQVERVAGSDQFAAVFLQLDATTRVKALETIGRVKDKARKAPPARKAPNRNERIKVRWTDDLITRFRLHAPWVKDNKALALKLGLPDYCAEAVRVARYRYLQKPSATRSVAQKPQIESVAPVLSLAA